MMVASLIEVFITALPHSIITLSPDLLLKSEKEDWRQRIDALSFARLQTQQHDRLFKIKHGQVPELEEVGTSVVHHY